MARLLAALGLALASTATAARQPLIVGACHGSSCPPRTASPHANLTAYTASSPVWTHITYSIPYQNMGTTATRYSLAFAICDAMKDYYPHAFCNFRFVEVHYGGCSPRVDEGAWVVVFYDHQHNKRAETFAQQYRDILKNRAKEFLEYITDYNTANMATAVDVGMGAGNVKVTPELAPLAADGVVIGPR